MLKYIREQMAERRIQTMRLRLQERERRKMFHEISAQAMPRQMTAQVVCLDDINPGLAQAISERLGMLGQVGGDDDDGPADNPAASPNPSLN